MEENLDMGVLQPRVRPGEAEYRAHFAPLNLDCVKCNRIDERGKTYRSVFSGFFYWICNVCLAEIANEWEAGRIGVRPSSSAQTGLRFEEDTEEEGDEAVSAGDKEEGRTKAQPAAPASCSKAVK
ncbi:hypothetical protein COCOBI_03-7100 [Coccomyxa sp. Obi]|nr:hypothetical protein COCOBI_03-7100 [Coccomyxa sp. Obi]